MRKKRHPWAAIGEAMGRSGSAVWTEWHRNRVKGSYVPEKAHRKAYVRRRASKFQGKKIVGHPGLKKKVDGLLRTGISPETVAGRITKQEKQLPSVSRGGVERYLGSVYGRQIEIVRAGLKAKGRSKKRGVSKKLEGRVFIEKRPEYAGNRSRVGDAEADFIVAGRSGSGRLLIVIDRKLRKKFIEKVCPVSIGSMERAFLRIKAKYPEMKTVTTDNDILFARHEHLAKLLVVKIYFCHPYHSWEKGTVENANKLIRQFIPKGSDISKISRRFIGRLEQKLNDRPMKRLDYLTPNEAMERHRMKMKNKKTPDEGPF